MEEEEKISSVFRKQMDNEEEGILGNSFLMNPEMDESNLDFFKLDQPGKKESEMASIRMMDNGKIGLIPTSFIMAILGKPGFGKSSMVMSLLSNPKALKGEFIATFFLSPSDLPGVKFNTGYCRKTFDLKWLQTQLNILNEEVKRVRKMKGLGGVTQGSDNMMFQGNDRENKVLIVFDDMISSIKKAERDPFFRDLVFNRRKMFSDIGISIIVLTQRYILIPTFLRMNLNLGIMFNISTDDIEQVWKEHMGKREMSQMVSLVESHLEKYKYNFVYLKFDTRSVFLNFECKV
jgi:hypothetical protein